MQETDEELNALADRIDKGAAGLEGMLKESCVAPDLRLAAQCIREYIMTRKALETGDIGIAYNCGEQKIMALLSTANRREIELRAQLAAAKEGQTEARRLAIGSAKSMKAAQARAEAAEEYLRKANAVLAKEKQRADENYMAFERAATRAEEAEAHSERLRAALEAQQSLPIARSQTASGRKHEDEVEELVEAVLKETPAQSLAKLKAAALRELKQYKRQQGESFFVWWRDIEIMAERLEAE